LLFIGVFLEYLARYVVSPILGFIADVVVNNPLFTLAVVGGVAGAELLGVPVVTEWLAYYAVAWVWDPLAAGAWDLWEWGINWLEGVVQDALV
jgi:hypothetical protein